VPVIFLYSRLLCHTRIRSLPTLHTDSRTQCPPTAVNMFSSRMGTTIETRSFDANPESSEISSHGESEVWSRRGLFCTDFFHTCEAAAVERLASFDDLPMRFGATNFGGCGDVGRERDKSILPRAERIRQRDYESRTIER
jgi:hypothetical protein